MKKDKISPLLDYVYNEELKKYEVVCSCSNVFFVESLKELELKTRCNVCQEKNKKIKIEDEVIKDLVIKFSNTVNKRHFDEE